MLLPHLVGIVTALDCSQLGMEFLDQTLEISNITSTPPVITKLKAYVNPCSPVQGSELCEKDDHFCFIENIGDKVTFMKPIGSFEKGANEMVSFFSENEYHGSHRPVPGRYTSPPRMEIFYNSATWGDIMLDGAIHMYCTEEPSQPELSIEEFSFPIVALRGPEYCALRNPDNKESHSKVTSCEEGKENQFEVKNETGQRYLNWIVLALLVMGLAVAVNPRF